MNRLRRFSESLVILVAVYGLFEKLRRPVQQIRVLKDLLGTRREMRHLRNAKRSDTGRRVLVVSLSDAVYQLKLEGMLAHGLKLKDCKITVLTSRKNHWGVLYHRAFGNCDFVYWEDYRITDVQQRNIDTVCEKFAQEADSFSAVKAWNYDGAWIGPQLLSTVARHMRCGSPNPRQMNVRNALLKLVPYSIDVVERSKLLLNTVMPDMIFLVEANYIVNGAIVDVAIKLGINVVQTIQPSRDDAMIFKRLTNATRRDHPASVDKQLFSSQIYNPLNAEENKLLQEEFSGRYGGKWVLQSRNQPNTVNMTRSEACVHYKIDEKKPITVVYVPVLWDANLFYGEDLFDDYGEWFVQTVRVACKNTNVNWFIKLHPANTWKLPKGYHDDALAETELLDRHGIVLPDHVRLLYPDTKISTLSLFKIADYGVTVRGTVGMEMPCFAVPVITAGTGRYSNLGFTHDSTTRQEYIDKLSNIHKIRRMTDTEVELAKRHAYTAFMRRPWRMQSFRADFSCAPPLNPNLRSIDSEVIKARHDCDLMRWAVWALDGSKVDYMHDD